MKLTDEQHRAVTARGVSVALSAGAGCGKTSVLTERFLAALEPGTSGDRPRLGQLVAITFTERAAREMRNRIRKACRDRLRECPEHEASYWSDLIRELDSARISTIHSFCGSLLRAHAVEAGVDPRFRVLDAAQAALLLFKQTDDLLRNRLGNRDEAALALATQYGLDRLRTMIARLLAVRQEIEWDFWRGETAEGLAARWGEFWRCDTLPRLLSRISESAASRTLLDLAMRFPPDHPTMRARCDLLLERLPKLKESRQPADDLAILREAAKVQGGGTKKNWVNDGVYEQFKNAAKSFREAIDDVADSLQFDAVAAKPAALAALQVLAFAADVAQTYENEKRELAAFDFNDLLILAKRLLVEPSHQALRKRLASQIHLLLVDEFQDTDPLQVELVKALCDNEYLQGKLFLVGDYKQSIYRFRGANPHVFRQLREEIPAAGQLPLSLNFRSQPAVLEFVNALFCETLGPNYEPLRPHRPQVSPRPSVEFLWAVPKEENEDDEHSDGETTPLGSEAIHAREPASEEMGRAERLRRREADWIARRLRQLFDSGEKIVWDEKAQQGKPAAREVRPGDVALLFRALTNVEYYEDALQRYGIDYYLVGGHAFYAQQEIYDLLNLLRAVEIPDDDVSLFGALRSPMFGLHDETLFWLFSDRGMRDAVVLQGELPEILQGPQRQQAERALAVLRELRAIKDRVPVARFLQEALDRTGYDALLLAEFLGQRKLANLQKLVEQARQFDRAGLFTLSDFIMQLSEFVARQPDEPLAATNPETTDVVKLMSIHQSKGLEFSVVIVPDLGRPRRLTRPPVAFTPELGPLVKDAQAATGYDLLMCIEDDEDLAETARLFYVAATRAADYLILSAGVESLDVAVGPWMELLAKRFEWALTQERKEKAAEAGSSSHPLVKVTTTEPAIHSKPVDLHRRRDLLKVVEQSRKMAAKGAGRRLPYLAVIPPDLSARRQYSFSRLTGRLHLRKDADDREKPSGDASWSGRNARELGTLVHSVFEEIDFARPADLAETVRRLSREDRANSPAEEDEAAALTMIGQFLAGPRAAELGRSRELHREIEFLLAWPPGAAPTAGRCYLQGFIDCLYRGEDDRWRLIDYKTNRVTAATISETAHRYEMQLLVYALAAETILGTAPAELAFCFLQPGLEYPIAWDDAARRRAVDLVNEALRQYD